jgi:Flp pilus assembly protein TadD
MSVSAATTRLALLEGYLEEDTGNDALRLAAFEAALEAGDLQAAALLAQGALALEPDAGNWLHRLAHLRVAQGDTAAAGRRLLEARQAGAPASVVDHDLAWLAFLQGDAQRCAQLLEPHLADAAAEPDRAVLGALQVLWLRALHQSRQFDAALDWMRAQEEAGRLHPAAMGAASVLAWDAGDLEAAERLARASLAWNTGEAEALVTLASLALARGQGAAAEELLGAAMASRPGEGRTWFLAAAAALQRGAIPLARERFAGAVARMPQHIGSLHGLGWASLLGGDLGQAREAFGRALALDPAFAESHGAVGLVSVLGGDVPTAEASIRTALKLDPASVTARYARAVLQGEAGKDRLLDLARRLLDRPGFFGESLEDAVRDGPAGSPLRS